MCDTTPSDTITPQTEGMFFPLSGLRSYLSQLHDPRAARGKRYHLVDLLTLLILAKLGGEDEMQGMSEWIRVREEALIGLLGIGRKRLPHQTTYDRVLAKMDGDAFDQVVGAFFAHKRDDGHWSITLDGKVLRGTIRAGETQGTHLLAAYVPERGVVLMQVEVDSKANEISAAPRLLQAIDLDGCVVTGDAMFTQRSLCQQIVKAGGDYVLPAKDNQPTLQQAIAELFMPVTVSPGHSPVRLPEHEAYSINDGHGRTEYRYLTTSSQLNGYLDWPQLEQVFRLQRLVHHHASGKLTYEVLFGITSLSEQQCAPARLLQLIRQHWHIENRLHYVRDVTFREDACTLRNPKRQRILATLNNLALGLLRQTRFRYLPQARRHFSLHFAQAFHLLL